MLTVGHLIGLAAASVTSSVHVTSVWHVETYGSTLSPLVTGDALQLNACP